MTPIDPVVLLGVSFALGIGFGVVVPALLRKAKAEAKAAASVAAATKPVDARPKAEVKPAPVDARPKAEVKPAPVEQEKREGRTSTAAPAPKEKRSVPSQRIKRLHADESLDVMEYSEASMTSFTKFMPQESLPSLTADEDLGEETPSVSLVSYIDDLQPDKGTGQDPLRVTAVGKTDIGMRRKRNDDRYVIVHDQESKRCLFAVIDGLGGGHGGGGLASRLAAEVITCRWAAPGLQGSVSAQRPTHANNLVWAIEQANKVIYDTGKETPQLDGMGATVVAAVYDETSRCMYIAHVGDSRAYRLRKGRCELLTLDHKVAHEGPMAAYLRRALGPRPQVKVDVTVGVVEPGDTYLFCSDGLSSMKSNQEIASLIASESDSDAAVARLIEEANRAGGKDNIAVVIVRLEDPRRPSKSIVDSRALAANQKT